MTARAFVPSSSFPEMDRKRRRDGERHEIGEMAGMVAGLRTQIESEDDLTRCPVFDSIPRMMAILPAGKPENANGTLK